MGSSLLRPGGQLHPFRLAVTIGATGSPVPCQRLQRAHATYTPGTTRATRRPLPGSRARLQGEPLSRDTPHVPVSMPPCKCFDASAVVHTCSSPSSPTCPAVDGTFTATLTTPALDRRSLRWFGISACTATPEGPPPSLAQHASCWRASTSSSLYFQDTRGVHLFRSRLAATGL